eukprot:43037-Eustigmatos_ZCMA.PRE.1
MFPERPLSAGHMQRSRSPALMSPMMMMPGHAPAFSALASSEMNDGSEDVVDSVWMTRLKAALEEKTEDVRMLREQ